MTKSPAVGSRRGNWTRLCAAPKEVSAGLLVFRHREEVEVLLGHPRRPVLGQEGCRGHGLYPKASSAKEKITWSRHAANSPKRTNLAAAAGDARELTPVNLKSGEDRARLRAVSRSRPWRLRQQHILKSNGRRNPAGGKASRRSTASPISRCRSRRPKSSPISCRLLKELEKLL